MNVSKILSALVSSCCLLSMLTGCASINSLPQSASDTDFSQNLEGRTGWAKYEEVVEFRGVDHRTAYLAAKAGLADAGFTIKRASYEKAMVIGEHGATAYDWNIVAGVYVLPVKNGSKAKVLVQASKDFGFNGDMTASSWTQDILKGMRKYIQTEASIENPNKRHFE